MAELRLDEVQAAFAKTKASTIDPAKTITPGAMSLDQLELFNVDQEIDRNSYDLWYENMLKGMVNADIPVLDFVAEPSAGFLSNSVDMANTSVLAATNFAGAAIESVSSFEKFKEAMGTSLAAGVAAIVKAMDPTMYEAYGGPEFIKGPGEMVDESEFIPSAGANAAERLGKRLRAISFYGYMNTKTFQQQLAQDADHPLLLQVGGAFGSVTTSALLATINPALAMWAIGGHVAANQYLEQASRGADWGPALGYAATIGAGVSQLERMSINLLYKKFSSRLALAGDSMIVNAMEEFSQSVFESGVEQVTGAEDRTVLEIFKNASFEAALGAIGGGLAGATTVQLAYNRMDKVLEREGIGKNARHKIIMRAIGDGSSILESVLREGMGITEDDLDLVSKISRGEINANDALLELNRRIIERQKAKGIDTYLDSDPDALIREQEKIDKAEELATQAKETPLTPDEQAEVEESGALSTPALEQKMAEKFGEVDIDGGGFLNPSGQVTGQEAGGQYLDHHIIARLITGKGGDEAIIYLLQKGFIRNKTFGNAINIELMVKPTRAQMERLKADFEGKDRITVDISTPGQEGGAAHGTFSTFLEFQQFINQTFAEQTGVEETVVTKADEKEMKILREGREAQINQELDLLESQKALVNKEIETRQEEGKSTKALENQRDKINSQIETLLDEIDLLPTVMREDLAAKIVATKGRKITTLRNLAEVVAARLEKERITQVFKKKAADLKAAREELLKYVRAAFKGLDVPKKFLTRVARVTPNTIDKFMAEVDQARADIIRPALVKQIQKVLDRIAPKVKAGKAAGVLQSASLQDIANELIRVSKIDGQTAAQLIRQKQELLANYFRQAGADNAVTGEVDVDQINLELEVLQNLAGLDQKDETGLMNALKYAQDKVQLLKTGAKLRQQMLKEQRERDRQKAIREMRHKQATKFVPKWLKTFTHYSTSNLSAMLRSLSGKKNIANSVIGKKIAALEEAPRKEASFNYLYMDALEQLTKRTFGLKTAKDYAAWKADWFTEGKGFSSGEIQFNNGKTGQLMLSKADVSYWWMVTHDREGNPIPELIEQFTGDNQRTELEDKLANGEISQQDFDQEVAKIRGNAIPLNVWEDMMYQFEQNPAHIEFAQSQRALYNTVYSIINPVYRMYMGVDLPRVMDYIPWHRDVGVEGEVYSALDDFNDLVQTTPKATMLRTPGASAAFRQVGDIEIFQYFIQEMGHFNAFALPMKDLISFIRNKDIRREINLRTDGVELAGGTVKDGDFYKNMRKMADYIMSRGRSMNEFSLGMFNTLRSNLSIAYLGEPSKGIMQTSSMWMALAEPDITWMDWAKGIAEFMEAPGKALEILDKAPMMKFRYRDLMIEMRDAIQYIKQKEKAPLTHFRKWVTPKAFWFVRKGNRLGAGLSGYVVFKKVFDETGDINEAFRRFDNHLINTQQSAVATQLSPFQAGQTARLLSHFQSAVIQYVRIYTKAWDDFARGRIKLGKLVDTMLVFHILMPVMRWMLKALIRGGDFDEKELAKDVVIGPLTAGFIIPDIVEGLISVALDVHSFGAGSTLATAADKIEQSAKQVKKRIQKVVSGQYYDVADLANTFIEAGEETSALLLPIPGLTFDAMQATIKASQGDMSPLDILSVILGESVESLEFKNKGSNNTLENLFGR